MLSHRQAPWPSSEANRMSTRAIPTSTIHEESEKLHHKFGLSCSNEGSALPSWALVTLSQTEGLLLSPQVWEHDQRRKARALA